MRRRRRPTDYDRRYLAPPVGFGLGGGGLGPLGGCRTAPAASGGGASPPGTPALWLAADRIVGLSDADPVATWADQSGNGYDAAQPTAGSRPTYRTGLVNGLPAVRFDGVDDYLYTAHTFAAMRTLAVVCRVLVEGVNKPVVAGHSVYDCELRRNGAGGWLGPNAGGTDSNDWGNGGTQYVNGVATDAAPVGSWLVTVVTSSSPLSRDLDVGGVSSLGRMLNVEVAEVLVYADAEDPAALYAYLGGKYGL